MDLLKSDSLKRLVVLVVTSLLLLLSKKLGLHLGPEEVAGIAGLAAAYLVQSGLKSAAQAKAAGVTAAAAVESVEAADAVLRKP